jgi:hypothetical protein
MSISSNNLQMLLKAAVELAKQPELIDALASVEVTWVKHELDSGDGEVGHRLMPDIRITFR